MEEHEKRPVGGKRLAPESRGGFWNNWGYLIVTVAVIVVLFKVIFQLSWVPSGSMETTIPEDTLLISWQLPYMVSDPTPQRGDIVTFWSDELGKVLVKRVIGLPGDTITFADGYHEHIDALDKAAEQDVRCSIRPEEFIICKDGTDGIHGTVQECTYLGLNTHYTIDTDQGDSVEIVEESSIGEGLKKGEKVLLKVKKEKINVFTKDGDTNLIRSDAYEKQ